MQTQTCFRAFLQATVLAILATPSVSAAAIVKVCAEYKVNYSDADIGTPVDSDLEGDYFATNSDKVARGARIVLDPVGGGASRQKFAAWDGADAGCAVFISVPSGTLFDIKIVAHAEVRGNKIKVRNTQASPGIFASTMESGWSHSSGAFATVTVNTSTAAASGPWNVAAAAGHAMWRRGGGLSGKTFDFFLDNGPCGSGSCHRDGDIFLSNTGRNSRIITVHEMGHAVEWFAGPRSDANYGANSGVCATGTSSHEMASKEWQSAAIREGWAHFYAAVAFNQTQYADCGFIYYKDQDYDTDGVNDGHDFHEMSCEQGVNNVFGSPSPAVVDAKDYLGDFCGGTADHGTELDWLRFWWDLLHDEGVPFSDCLEILVVANSGIFQAPSAGLWTPAPTGATLNNKRPGWRMRESADFLGLLTEWDSQDNTNGVHR